MDGKRRFAWVFLAVAASWVALLVLALQRSGWPGPPGGRWWAAGSPDPRILQGLGALVPGRVGDGQVQRLLTYGFLHGSALGLLFDLWFAWWAFRMFERLAGASRAWIVFVIALVAGGLAHDATARGAMVWAPLVGAWPGVLGLAGALGAWAFSSKEPLAKATRRSVIFLVLLVAAFALVLDAPLASEVGGLIAGVGAMLLLGPRRAMSVSASGPTRVVAALLLLATVAAGAVQASRSPAPDREVLAPLLRDLGIMERLAYRLYDHPLEATPARRTELASKLDALAATSVLEDREAKAAFRAYLEAWRPVAEGNVPDPFAFDAKLEAARSRWRTFEKRLRASGGVPRGL